MPTASGGRVQGWASIARAPLLVACIAFALYLPSLGFNLVSDDPILLQSIHERLHAGGLGAVLSWEFMSGTEVLHTGYFRPVILFSLLFDERLGGAKPWVFHLTNLMLHAFTSGMVVVLLRRLLRDGRAAVFGGLLFAVHPVHVESVAFVSGRTDLWAACFTFLATWIWMRERDREPERARVFAWMGVAFCLVLGALSKEVAVMVVPVWLAWDLFARDDMPGRPASWIRRNRTWLAFALAAFAVVIALRLATVGAFPQGAPSLLLPRLFTYARLLVVPWPLNSYYTPDELSLGPGMFVGALLAACMYGMALRGGSRRLGVASVTWTLLFLVPILGVATLSGAPVAERFLYIPSFGACLAAATLWGRLHRRSSVAALTVGGAVLVLFAGATTLRSRVWRDDFSLYTDMARTSPKAFNAQYNLGNELIRAGRPADAEASLSRAVELAPERADAWTSLGVARSQLGRAAEALQAFDEAVRLQPDLIVAQKNREWAYEGRFDALAKRGEWAKALESLQALPQTSFDRRDLLMRRALALFRLGQPVEALASLEGARGLAPGDARLLIEIGEALANAGRQAEADRANRLAQRVAGNMGEGSR
jgi:tetratricopeptide (TPR) repeat protein